MVLWCSHISRLTWLSALFQADKSNSDQDVPCLSSPYCRQSMFPLTNQSLHRRQLVRSGWGYFYWLLNSDINNILQGLRTSPLRRIDTLLTQQRCGAPQKPPWSSHYCRGQLGGPAEQWLHPHGRAMQIHLITSAQGSRNKEVVDGNYFLLSPALVLGCLSRPEASL